MMHIAMHVKSMKRLPTHNVIYSIVHWYLKEKKRFIGGSFWAIGDRKTVPRRFFHGPTVVNGRQVPLDMTDSKRKRK